MPLLPPKEPLSNETDEEAFSRKLELLDSENYASTNKHIPLLLVRKRIQQVVQDILYYYLFYHVHIQALGTEWRLRDSFVQISNLNLYGHKLRNVMIFVEVNTTTQVTTFSGGRHFRKEQVDRQNSHNDKVYERKKELQTAVEMLTQTVDTQSWTYRLVCLSFRNQSCLRKGLCRSGKWHWFRILSASWRCKRSRQYHIGITPGE
jgi:hypothetical protein